VTRIEIRRREATPGQDFGTDLHPLIRRVYAARGVARDEELDLSLNRILPVGSLPGVEAAAELLAAHRAGRVLVVGDFDADGATSTALVVRALRCMGFAHVDYLVPNRFRFGYGLTPGIVKLAAARDPSLIVTVDNGISSLAGAQAARELKIHVLITDHHLPGRELPQVDAIVNPNLVNSTFGSRALAGVGVAFYVIAALANRLRVSTWRPAELLDLVALGTVADMVTLDRNNRILVDQGLKRIRAGRCVPGVAALLGAAGRRMATLDTADLGFAVAPRLNAAGRLDDMSIGIECLLADDAAAASVLAGRLSRLNEERREIESRMQSQAVEIVAQVASDGADSTRGLCLYDADWHQGVVGLVAGRLKDRMHCPVVAFAPDDDGSLRGSARSVAGVHIRDVLDSIATDNPGLIEKFGGHAMAAGLTLNPAHLESFRVAFAAQVGRRMQGESSIGVLHSDGELGAAELTVDTARLLRDAGPWGQGFAEPLFDGDFEVLDAQLVAQRHLKLKLRGSADNPGIDAIAFAYIGGPCEDPRLRAGSRVRVAYRLEVNEFNRAARPQLNCQHIAVW
jgi:single-stranded-DNA-specific exonuclease